MKAVIMAGGAGTRGRPYTEYFPKAMTPVRGRPLIDHIVRHLRSFDFIGQIVIIADFEGLGGQISGYYGKQKGIKYVQDSQSGTAGDLVHAGPVLGRGAFTLWFADNLCAIDLGAMKDAFRSSGAAACVATRKRRREETGFAAICDGMITKFMEKPMLDLPMSECLGIYMMNPGIIDVIRRAKSRRPNLSYDILQRMAGGGHVSSYDIGAETWLDVESPIILSRRSADVDRITKRMGRARRARGA